jgi:hypothetical protein
METLPKLEEIIEMISAAGTRAAALAVVETLHHYLWYTHSTAFGLPGFVDFNFHKS